MAFGTLSISDLLATTDQSVVQIGEDKAFDAIAMDLAAHNMIVNDDLMPLVEKTADRRRRYGGAATFVMREADEYGSADAEKVGAGQNVEFPLRKYMDALQWTRDWMEEHTPAELAAQYNALKIADLTNVSAAIRNALFNPTNYTFVDRYVDNVSLTVKRLLNADGVDIPPNRYGTTFDGSTHTHYLATSTGTLAAGDVTALINTVLEHDARGPIMLYINSGDEAAVRALTGFTAVQDQRLVLANDVTYASGPLDIINTENRRIGLFGAAEVWVKSWIPAHYMLALDAAPGRRALVWRVRRMGGPGGDLRLVAQNEMFPLRAEQYLREFGVGVWDRSAAAVMITNSATYTAPTIA